MTLDEYYKAMDRAIKANPPSKQPYYAVDPNYVWRYYMRSFGHGLDIYSDKEVNDLITSLYSNWYIRLEFISGNMKVDAKTFYNWIREARDEAINRHRNQIST